MSDVSVCPRCGKKPDTRRFYAGVIGYYCCGHEASTKLYWEQYAAAMSLAIAIRKHSMEASSKYDTTGEMAEIAAMHVADMEQRVLEVFE